VVLVGRKRENRRNRPTFGPPPPVRKQLAVLTSLPPGVPPSATTTRTATTTMTMTRLKQHALQFSFKTSRQLKNDVPWLSALSKYMID
jgi:hypothetical protein